MGTRACEPEQSAARPSALVVTNAVGDTRSSPIAAERRLQRTHHLVTLEVGGTNRLDDGMALDAHHPSREIIETLKAQHFDLVAVPFVNQLYAGPFSLVAFLSRFAPAMHVEFASGESRVYLGNDLQRLQYTSAYLHSLFSRLPRKPIDRACELGCSDGLCSDLVQRETGARVTGLDVLADVGQRFTRTGLSFCRANGVSLPFASGTFDLTYSIATMEHVADPYLAIREMERVTRPGGFCYVQAGPLYFSPFGHHMFGYFDDLPWIHLRRTREAIIELGLLRGIDVELQATRGLGLSDYVTGMLGTEHINGKRLAEYRLDEIAETPGLEVVLRTTSKEGDALLSPEVREELSAYGEADLTAHGFELLFRVKEHGRDE